MQPRYYISSPIFYFLNYFYFHFFNYFYFHFFNYFYFHFFNYFYFYFFFYLLTWWLWNKPDVDHGNSVHKDVWVMLLEKTRLSTSRTIVPAKIILFNTKNPLIYHASYLVYYSLTRLWTAEMYPHCFLGEKELDIVTRHVCNYFKALRLKQWHWRSS